jgi:hypothetical protein
MKITTQSEFESLPPGHYTISRSLVSNLLNIHWRNAMLNRQLTKIVNLYHDGVSSEVCIAIIMDLTKDSTSLKKGTWIHKFYETITKKEQSDEKIPC